MADLSPIETAGLAFTAHGVPASVAEAAARDAFASLAQHRDAIARVLCRRIHRSLWPVESVPSDEEPCANCREHTDAVLAYLTGGAS